MDWLEEMLKKKEIEEAEALKKTKIENIPNTYDDEGTQEYAERPKLVAVNAELSIFDHSSINKQHGINTKPSVFESTWK